MIYTVDGHYEMPDGDLICDFDRGCIGDYIRNYYVFGIYLTAGTGAE